MKRRQKIKNMVVIAGISLSLLGIIGSYIISPVVNYISGSEQQAVPHKGTFLPLDPFPPTPTLVPYDNTPTPTASNGNGKPQNNSIDDMVSTSSVNGDEPFANSIDLTATLTSARGVQAGFLSPEVTSYSAQGFGGMKASLPNPSSTLNYFYLIINDSKGNIVKFSPYEHGVKYTLMQMSHDDTVFFTWDNGLLPLGKYTAIIAKGPQILFNDSNPQILKQRQFEVKHYDFDANNSQNTSSDGYSIHAANGLLTVLASNRRFGIDSIDVKVYDEESNIIWKEGALIAEMYQLDFKRRGVPSVNYRAEVVINYTGRDNVHHRNVEQRAVLAAQFSGKK